MTREGLGGPVDDLVAEIARRVVQAGTGMSPAAIEEIVASFATTRSRIRRLADGLAGRPEVLTDGRSPAPLPVGDLLIALRAAGARAVSAPVCAAPGCGKQLVAAAPRAGLVLRRLLSRWTESTVRALRPDAVGRDPWPGR